MPVWNTLGAQAVVSLAFFGDHAERMRGALAQEWEMADSPEKLAWCMRATGETFACRDAVVTDIRNLFTPATYCTTIDNEQMLAAEFAAMTVPGCLAEDTQTGAPHDRTVRCLFPWLADVSEGDLVVAVGTLAGFTDLLFFVADTVLAETENQGSPERLLLRVVS